MKKFSVLVSRRVDSAMYFEVEAGTMAEAEDAAIKAACNYNWSCVSSGGVDYEAMAVTEI